MASVVGTVASIASARSASKRAKAQDAAQAEALRKSQEAEQTAFRDNIRGQRSGQGTGDFRASSTGGFSTALKQLTGR